MGMPQPFNMPQFQGMGPANQMPPIANQQTQQPILNDSSKQQKSIFENQKLNLNNMPNISDTKNEMTKLVSSLDKASTSVEKQSEASRTNTESLQSTREAFQGFEDSSESQKGAGSAGTPPANVTMPITANFTPTLSVKMAEDALSTLQSSQAEMNEGLRSELRSAIDQVNRRIADMRTQSAQKN
jgi:hypothetical protein